MNDVYLPILKDNKDPHYRYKMPKLTAKIEGSGNGIKTVITNMATVAKALDRPPAYPTKYFGCELGAQVTIHNDLFVVNGSHDVDKLQNLLYRFIKQFVLCPKCSNPETTLSIVKQTISQRCIACGKETTLPKSVHKLTTFIINHPPDGGSAGKAAKVAAAAAGKAEKGEKRKGGGKSGAATTGSSDAANGNGEFVAGGNDDEDAFDEAEFETTAYAERMRGLTDGFSNGIYASDAKENANIFYKLVKERKEAGQLGDVAVHKELVREAERLDIKDKATLILSELLFTENIVAEVKTHRHLLLRFCHNNRKAQKYLLGGFEKLVGDVYKDKLFNSSIAILQALYDQDILEEESIIEWASKESKKYVGKEMSRKIHEKVAPFIKWLKEAEVEENSDEEDEEGDEDGSDDGAASSKSNDSSEDNKKAHSGDDETEVEFSYRVSGISIQEVAKQNGTATAAASTGPVNATDAGSGKGEVEDIDIDNI